MSDPENTTQPLISSPRQTAVNVEAAAQGGRPSRALKVAGIMLLVGCLIVGQAMIAYFLLSQRSDINSLEEQSNSLKAELTKGRSVAVPMRMHMPVDTFPVRMDDSVDEEASTGTPETVPQMTDCQMEAAGLKAVPVPGFRPTCDARGLYQAQQCFLDQCWCVNPVNGKVVPGSITTGAARCRAAALTGSLSNVLTMPDVIV